MGHGIGKTIVTIIPCTSNGLALRFPFTYSIKPNNTNGLVLPTIALVFHIRTIDISLLKNKIGKLDSKSFSNIKKITRKLIG